MLKSFASNTTEQLYWNTGTYAYRFSNINHLKKIGISAVIRGQCQNYVPGAYGIQLELKSKFVKNNQTLFFTNSLVLDFDKILGQSSCNTIGNTVVEEIFDISDIENIEEIHAFLFCNKKLASTDSLELIDLNVYLGGEKQDYSTEGLFIYCEGSSNYDKNDYAPRTIYVKWVYKENDVLHVITPFSYETLPENAWLTWKENDNDVKQFNDSFIVPTKKLNIYKDMEKYTATLTYDSISSDEPKTYEAQFVFQNQTKVDERTILKPEDNILTITSKVTAYKDIYNADGRIVDFGILKNVDNSLLYFTKNPYTSNFSLEDIEIVATIKVPKNKTNLVIEETRDFMQDATANDPEYVLYTKKITDLQDLNLFPYSVSDYYNPSHTNNTIICELSAYDITDFYTLLETQSYSVPITFSRSGVCKTDYVLQVTLTDESGQRTSSIKSKKGVLYATAKLYNAQGVEQEIIADINWSWYQRVENTEKIKIQPIGKNQCQLICELDGYITGHNYSYILMAQYNTYKDNSIYTQVITYNPIGLNMSYVQENDDRVSYTMSYLEGPTTVVYDSAGGNPSFYQTEYELFNQTNTKQKIEIIPYINNTQATINNGSYCSLVNNLLHPPLVFSKGTETATVLFIKDLYDQLLWIQPILLYQTKSFSSVLNDWNGKSISIQDTGDQQHILTPVLGAGSIDDNGYFSGVVLGDAATIIEDGSVQNNATGIYGYCKNEQTYGLQDNGTAFFGKRGGRVVINGESTVLYSDNFNAELAKGTVIQAKSWDDIVSEHWQNDIKYGTRYQTQFNSNTAELRCYISPGVSSNHYPYNAFMHKDDDDGAIVLQTSITDATQIIFDLDIIPYIKQLINVSNSAKAGTRSYSFLLYTNQEVRRYFFFFLGTSEKTAIAYTFWSWDKTASSAYDNTVTRADQFVTNWRYRIWDESDNGTIIKSSTSLFGDGLSDIHMPVQSSEQEPCRITLKNYEGFADTTYAKTDYIAFSDTQFVNDALSNVFQVTLLDFKDACIKAGFSDANMAHSMFGGADYLVQSPNMLSVDSNEFWFFVTQQIDFEAQDAAGNIYDFTSLPFRTSSDQDLWYYSCVLNNLSYLTNNIDTPSPIGLEKTTYLNASTVLNTDLEQYRNSATQKLNFRQAPTQGGLIDLKTGAFIGSDFYMYESVRQTSASDLNYDNSQILSSAYARQFYDQKLPAEDSDLLISCFRENASSHNGTISLDATDIQQVYYNKNTVRYEWDQQLYNGNKSIPAEVTHDIAMTFKDGRAYFQSMTSSFGEMIPFIYPAQGYNPFAWESGGAANQISNRDDFVYCSGQGAGDATTALFFIYTTAIKDLEYLCVEFHPWRLLNSFIKTQDMKATISCDLTIPQPYGSNLFYVSLQQKVCSQTTRVLLYQEPINHDPSRPSYEYPNEIQAARNNMYQAFRDQIDSILYSLKLYVHAIEMPTGIPLMNGTVLVSNDRYVCSGYCELGNVINDTYLSGAILTTTCLQPYMDMYNKYVFKGAMIYPGLFYTTSELKTYWNNIFSSQRMFDLSNTYATIDINWIGYSTVSPEQLIDADNYFLLFKNGKIYNKNAILSTISSIADAGSYTTLELTSSDIYANVYSIDGTKLYSTNITALPSFPNSLTGYSQSGVNIDEKTLAFDKYADLRLYLSRTDSKGTVERSYTGMTGWVRGREDYSIMLFYRDGLLVGKICYDNHSDTAPSCYEQWCSDNFVSGAKQYYIWVYGPGEEKTERWHTQFHGAKYFDLKDSRTYENLQC